MLPFSTAIETIGQAGFEGVEVMVTGDRTTQDGKELRALAESNGLVVGSIHAPFLLVTRGVFSTDPIEKIKRSIEVAEAAGATNVVVHPPYRWQTAYSRWLEEDLADFSEGTDVTISMENMFPVWVRGRSLTFHRVVTIDQLSKFQNVTLDTSHCAVSGIDILAALKELGSNLGHVHLSNNLGNGRDTHSPLEQGVLPMIAFLDEMRSSGYSGSLTLEMDVRDRASKPTELLSLLKDQSALLHDKLR